MINWSFEASWLWSLLPISLENIRNSAMTLSTVRLSGSTPCILFGKQATTANKGTKKPVFHQTSKQSKSKWKNQRNSWIFSNPPLRKDSGGSSNSGQCCCTRVNVTGRKIVQKVQKVTTSYILLLWPIETRPSLMGVILQIGQMFSQGGLFGSSNHVQLRESTLVNANKGASRKKMYTLFNSGWDRYVTL